MASDDASAAYKSSKSSNWLKCPLEVEIGQLSRFFMLRQPSVIWSNESEAEDVNETKREKIKKLRRKQWEKFSARASTEVIELHEAGD